MSGAEQFDLDVDIDSLRGAQHGLVRLSEHLAGVATMTGQLPGDIGAGWTGPAATTMKAELAGLSTQCSRFSPMFQDAAGALGAFADAAETFQMTTLPQYIRKWGAAESDAKTAYDKADSAYDSQIREAKKLTDPAAVAAAQAAATSTKGIARGGVADGQRYTMAAIDSQFSALKAEVGVKAKAAGDLMGTLTVVAVSDSVAKDFIGYPSSGQMFGGLFPSKAGVFPADLGTDGALPGMTLVARKHAVDDAGTVAGSVQDWRKNGGPIDPATLAMLQKRQSDPDFASALLQDLGPQALAALPGELTQARVRPTWNNDEQMAGEYAWQKSAPELLNALGVVLAVGTTAQKDAALPDTWTRQFLEAAKKDSYAPVLALMWAAQKSNPDIQFGTEFLTKSTNAITDYVSADISIPDGEDSTNNLARLKATLGKYTSESNYLQLDGDVDAGDLPDGWLKVDDPMHTMFQALGANEEASTNWLHQGLEPDPEAATRAAPGHFMSPQVQFWLEKHPDYTGADQLLWGADKGAGLGKVLKAGMTSGDALAHDAAQNTAFFFREMGANNLELPEGAKDGARSVFEHWVTDLNWNTTTDKPQGTMLNVMDNPDTLDLDDTGHPYFYQPDVKWLLKQSFNTDKQVAEYAELSLSGLRYDFNRLAQNVPAGKTPELTEFAKRFGQWKGLLTDQNNSILETSAGEAVKVEEHKKAFASFLVAVLTAPLDKLGLPSVLGKMADKANYKGQIALTDSMLSNYFETNAIIDKAQKDEGDTSNASYSDGRAMLVQWAVENSLLEALGKEGKLTKEDIDQLSSFTTKTPTGYTVKPGDAFNNFIRNQGTNVLKKLGLDGYSEAYSFDPAAGNKSK